MGSLPLSFTFFLPISLRFVMHFLSSLNESCALGVPAAVEAEVRAELTLSLVPLRVPPPLTILSRIEHLLHP
jgi:hypothetical protein